MTSDRVDGAFEEEGAVPRTEVLYLSSAPSPAQFQAMKDARKVGVQEVTYGMPESGYTFHWLIRRGLVEGAGCDVYSLVGRSATPRFYRGGYWPAVTDRPAPHHVVHHSGLPNVRVLKQVWLAAALAVRALQWRVRTRSVADRILIADAAYATALPGVLWACGGSHIKKIAIYADIYSFMADVSDASSKGHGWLVRLGRRVMPSVYARLDGHVLLTAQMNEVVNPGAKPHHVMEGLVNSVVAGSLSEPENKTPGPTVLYAGALRREYGLDSLIEGFGLWKRPDARLVIYGGGDYAAEIVDAARRDPRIDFRGSTTVEQVVAEEQRAWLLVNPRPADAQFTRYSFPSKTMEYLASGTPVLTTRLAGMPQEYYEYVLTIDDVGPRAVCDGLQRAFALSPQELLERGQRGKQFVLQHKNHITQARRLLEFARSC